MQNKEIKFLQGSRFDSRSNHQFIMLQSEFEQIDYESKKWIEQLQRYVARHKQEQVKRLEELKRYYLGDNNIKYRPPKKDRFAADNRIASDFAKYITTFEQGYMLGNPVEYKNEDAVIQDMIDDFSARNNEEYHNVKIKTDLSIYGRAYELLTVAENDGQAYVKLYHLPTEQTFVIYDDTYEQNSLMGVNYYTVDYGDSRRRDFIRVFTADSIHEYINDNASTNGMAHIGVEPHFFNGVPVNEFSNNEDRTGAYESVLDNIDAYDLSQSELANFQQNSNDAILLISGNPYTGADENDYLEDGRINPNGRLGISLGFKEAQVIILDDNPNPGGATPDAKYLVKQYDSAGAEAYKQRLVQDILRFTFTPDTSDLNFSGQQSGEAMKYKLMASDNYRGKQERLFKKALMRRLRLAVNIWKIKGNESVGYDLINDTSVIFSPNYPRNETGIVEVAKNLYGVISDQTVFEILEQVTGVDSEAEIQRLEEEKEEGDLFDFQPLESRQEANKEVLEDEPTIQE